ncbi:MULTISPECIES: choline BCCT transporter BetT [Brachybacterium]|uniref:High-affinity choline transporter BetT n=1 Tax=Brachybacterium alimentarium TaxID=47845 RepID=A0A2A3YIH1_9MICO|nr:MULTISPECIES: choline BCCT transporter BetT [Brachybacterium]PCC34055.1 high-affinity choline transporter BetT [Brachybacterium alimentarium]PCC39552.1 high-affinity choline transporter BetT [Brachybacterium alimentarium]RCS64592.1 high-affinity choline transporter BetT [Brachybacterium sp. JB7]RCS71012.1 high-affinity choline transporter BetT [Brachybacterium alimentarium]RCS74770.1 high-affinity choline transporter BetT [Brachybacterium alimentarium]
MAEAAKIPRPLETPGAGRDPGGRGSGSPSSSATAPTPSPVNWPVFVGTAVLIVAFVLFAAIWPDTAETVIFGSMGWVATNFGWYYVLTATLVVLFVLIVAFSKVGGTRMGPDHSVPKYNLFTWAAMLFAAGIGVDLMFFGISGPATNFLTPPDVPAGSEEAARMAPIWTIFHYGIPGWAMYALMGMAFGLFAYRYHLPLSIRSALAPIFGKRIHGPVGHVAEIGATIGTIFGISVSLGIGVVFLNFGLSALFGIPNSLGVQIALMALAVFITILSTVSGVDKGIRRLSELNVILAIILMLWVLFSGNTHELLNSLVQNIGDFFSRFPSMMMNTFAYTDGAAEAGYSSDQWMADWTLFFWAWWIAWAPFVSLFLARISRGRTLRQFVVGVLLIPFSFILLWVSIFGNAALSFFGDAEFLDLAINQPESGFFNLLQQYPGATFTTAVALVTGLFFYVTSADSGSLVMANMTSKASTTDSDGAPWLRIVWAVITGALTLVMLFINGVYTLQAATVMVGLPLSVLIYLVMFSLWKVLRTESMNLESRRAALPAMLTSRVRDAGTGERGSWRQRLHMRMSYADEAKAREYVESVAAPAVEEVAAELAKLGADVSCHRGDHPDCSVPFVDLVVSFRDAEDFKYQAYPVAYSVPSFAANLSTVRDVYYRIEIFSMLGSRGRDIMGYTKEQVITDVLDSYDHHIMYLTMSQEIGTATGTIPVTAPETWIDTDQIDPTDDHPTDPALVSDEIGTKENND